MIWALRLIAIGGLLVVAGVWVTEWGGVWHGHPLYGSLLFATALICAFLLFRSRRRVADRTGLRLVLRWVGLAALIGWLGLMAWLRPLTAEEPALSAMESSDSVQVTEWPTELFCAHRVMIKRWASFSNLGPRLMLARMPPCCAPWRRLAI